MLNTITICGRIVNELDLKMTVSGKEALSFTVACERDFKNGNGEKETDFIDVVTFGNTAKFVNFGKGRMAIVDGRLQTRNWEDKNGNKRKSVEIVANNVYFADSKTNTEQNTAPNFEPSYEEIGDGDLPF